MFAEDFLDPLDGKTGCQSTLAWPLLEVACRPDENPDEEHVCLLTLRVEKALYLSLHCPSLSLRCLVLLTDARVVHCIGGQVWVDLAKLVTIVAEAAGLEKTQRTPRVNSHAESLLALRDNLVEIALRSETNSAIGALLVLLRLRRIAS